MSVSKLILGTAGLGGLSYGRDRRTVGESEAKAIIKRAVEAGIETFDTAPVYGHAEKWLSEALDRPAMIYTKTNGNVANAAASLVRFVGHRLRYLVHNWEKGAPAPFEDGASIYSQSLGGAFIAGFSIIQVDWNILSQPTLDRSCYVNYMGQRPYIIARSVFLQGVLMSETLPLPGLQPYLEAARSYAAAYGVDLPTLALRAALENPFVSAVVIGPTRLEELEQAIAIAERPPLACWDRLLMLKVTDPALTDPRTWKAVA